MNFRAAGSSRKGAKTQSQAVLALGAGRLGVGQVNFAPWRWWAPLVIALALLCLAQAAFAQPPAPADGTIPPEAMANRLVNGSFGWGGGG